MFAYCNNNAVNGADPCGRCLHHWRFWEDCEDCKGPKPIIHDVPVYSQGDTLLCWAFCQVMIENFKKKDKLDQDEATERAKEIAISLFGPDVYNRPFVPQNAGRRVRINDIEDLSALLADGPIYAYYKERKFLSSNAHFAVVIGVDVKNNLVYVNDPAHGKTFVQTFEEFQAGLPGTNSSMPLKYVRTVKWDD